MHRATLNPPFAGNPYFIFGILARRRQDWAWSHPSGTGIPWAEPPWDRPSTGIRPIPPVCRNEKMPSDLESRSLGIGTEETKREGLRPVPPEFSVWRTPLKSSFVDQPHCCRSAPPPLGTVVRKSAMAFPLQRKICAAGLFEIVSGLTALHNPRKSSYSDTDCETRVVLSCSLRNSDSACSDLTTSRI